MPGFAEPSPEPALSAEDLLAADVVRRSRAAAVSTARADNNTAEGSGGSSVCSFEPLPDGTSSQAVPRLRVLHARTSLAILFHPGSRARGSASFVKHCPSRRTSSQFQSALRFAPGRTTKAHPLAAPVIRRPHRSYVVESGGVERRCSRPHRDVRMPISEGGRVGSLPRRSHDRGLSAALRPWARTA